MRSITHENFVTMKYFQTTVYTTYVPHLWLAKSFTALQQEFTINNNNISPQQLSNVIILLQLYRIYDLQCIYGFSMVFL